MFEQDTKNDGQLEVNRSWEPFIFFSLSIAMPIDKRFGYNQGTIKYYLLSACNDNKWSFFFNIVKWIHLQKIFQINPLLALKIYHPQGLPSDRILQKVNLETGALGGWLRPRDDLADAMFWNHLDYRAELLSTKSHANSMTWLCKVNRNPGSLLQYCELSLLFS